MIFVDGKLTIHNGADDSRCWVNGLQGVVNHVTIDLTPNSTSYPVLMNISLRLNTIPPMNSPPTKAIRKSAPFIHSTIKK